jgi:transcriptional regulator with XRE-family HTH domain
MATKKKTKPPPPDVRAQKKGPVVDIGMAARLKEARDDSGLTQSEIAKRIGINAMTASKLFNGKATPQQETLRRLCKELDVSPGWVTYGIPPKKLDPAALDQPIRAPRRGINPGVRQWLEGTPEGRATTTEERRWLYDIEWPDEPVRAPDLAYLYAVMAFREVASKARR